MKNWLAPILRRSGPPVIAVFLSGDPERSRSMAKQMRELVPHHPHIIIGPAPVDRELYTYAREVIELHGRGWFASWREARRRLNGRWIALAPFIWSGGGPLRWAPWLLAPRKLLAFNADLERHHLRLTCPIASWRFLRGEPVGDIFRPTPLAILRKVWSAIQYPVPLARGPVQALKPVAPAETGVTQIDVEKFWAKPDEAGIRCRTDRILVGSHPGLVDALEDQNVWLAFAARTMQGERGTWAVCAERPSAFAFRRDVYCELGGMGSGLTALSLRGWQLDQRTVIEPGPGDPPAVNEQFARVAPLLTPGLHVFPGRRPGRRRRVAVVSPYLPYPLSHGGAIRIYNLLRNAAEDTDIYLFAFAERESGREVGPLLDFCAKVVLARTPRWDPPSLDPPGVAKFRSKAMEAAVATVVKDEKIPIVQVEYTQLAHFEAALRKLPVKTILVEHDVTFDLHRQLRRNARGWARARAWLKEQRWKSYELAHARRFDRVIAMSEDDRGRLMQAGLPAERIAVVENGVDLERFQPAPAPDGPPELLFLGSFRHFPNVMAYRFLLEQIWPKLRAGCPEVRLTVVAGSDHAYFWRRHTGTNLTAAPPGVQILDFVEDVRPLYERATVAVAPLVVSAGTNIKVLEALAMQRPLVATAVAVAGLGVTSGENVMLAERADAFAAAVLGLLWNPRARADMAAAGRAFVEERYGWDTLAKKLRYTWDLSGKTVC